MLIIKKLFIISFFLILISCEPDKTYILVEPGKVEIEKVYSVSTNKKVESIPRKWIQFHFLDS